MLVGRAGPRTESGKSFSYGMRRRKGDAPIIRGRAMVFVTKVLLQRNEAGGRTA